VIYRTARHQRATITVAAAVLAGVALSACSSSGGSSSPSATTSSSPGATTSSSSGTTTTTATPVKVTITSFEGSFASLSEYVADSEGFFTKHGITPNFVNVTSGSAAMQALLAGSANMANVAIYESLETAAQGESTKFIVGAATSTFGELVVSSKVKLPPASAGYAAALKALKGMKIGVSSKTSATYYTLAIALQDAGLNPNTDVTVVTAGSLAAQLTALDSGQLQAFMSQEPTTTQAVDGGDQVAFYAYKGSRPAIFDNLITNGIAATDSYISANPAAVKGVHDAIAEADNYIADLTSAQTSTLATQIASDFPGVSHSVLTAAITHYQKLFTPTMSTAGVAAANKVLLEFGAIKKAVPYADVVGPTAQG
jgi:NitT/TauT family transport system substrate-binding protein